MQFLYFQSYQKQASIHVHEAGHFVRRLYLEHKHFLYSVHQNQINLDKIQKQKIPLVFSGQNFFNQRLKSKMLQCSF